MTSDEQRDTLGTFNSRFGIIVLSPLFNRIWCVLFVLFSFAFVSMIFPFPTIKTLCDFGVRSESYASNFFKRKKSEFFWKKLTRFSIFVWFWGIVLFWLTLIPHKQVLVSSMCLIDLSLKCVITCLNSNSIN